MRNLKKKVPQAKYKFKNGKFEGLSWQLEDISKLEDAATGQSQNQEVLSTESKKLKPTG